MSSKYSREKPRWSDEIKMAGILAHIKGMVLVFYFIGALRHECAHLDFLVCCMRVVASKKCFLLVCILFVFYNMESQLDSSSRWMFKEDNMVGLVTELGLLRSTSEAEAALL